MARTFYKSVLGEEMFTLKVEIEDTVFDVNEINWGFILVLYLGSTDFR